MKVAINQILDENNKSIYWLSKEINCDYQSLKRLIHNETSSINFDLLERICVTLNCTPDNILIIEKDT